MKCLLPLLVLTAVARANDAPNVLFVMADDLTAEALACYGNADCATPNLDRLAGRGLRFTRAYCQYPVCGPSRAAVMSGCYPGALGIMNNGGAQRFTTVMADRPSLAQHFSKHGWHTARVGKIYHMRVPGDITAGVDGPDHAASWDERHNAPGLEWMTPGAFEHLSHERLKWLPERHYGLGFGTAFYAVRTFGDGSDQADVRAADKAIELLEGFGDRPFFLAVGFVRPHVPLVAPSRLFARYDADGLRLAAGVAEDQADIPKAGISLNTRRIGAADDPAKQRRILQAYYASVTFVDEQVGRLLDALDALGLAEDTLVVFSSDHGYHLGEHDLWQKMSLHEESARIPLLVAGPGIPVGERDALVEQIDLFPTLAALAGLDIPPHCQGADLGRVLTDPTAVVREGAFCVKAGAQLWRTKQWAYLRYDEGGAELYDMRADPGQFTNLASERLDVVTALDTALEAKLTSLEPR
jgi:iduronate 2-sulfatase